MRTPVNRKRGEYLTAEDVDELPNGTATILFIADPDRDRGRYGTVDKRGFVRTFDGEYVPSNWNAEPEANR